MIKFFDIYKQDKKIHKHLLNDIAKLFKQGDFILGKSVSRFEKNFSKFCGVKYAISCANGTDALTIALKSLNLPNNSEVGSFSKIQKFANISTKSSYVIGS